MRSTSLGTWLARSTTGITLLAVHIPAGAYAGTDHIDDQDTVEFYDMRYDGHPVFGQFTGGRYPVAALLDQASLDLQPAVPDWKVGPGETRKIREWLRGL
jgi:hypothetical protein